MLPLETIEHSFGVPVDSGEPVQLTSDNSFWPAVSPDGQFIAYASGKYDSNPNSIIKVIPFGGGDPVKKFDVPIDAGLTIVWRGRPMENRSFIRTTHKVFGIKSSAVASQN